MINTYWEELNPSTINKNISELHEKILSEMEVPKWLNIKCPFCGKEQPLSSIREFGVKLNPRNVGDLFVVVCCTDCKKMDTVYFRKGIEKVTDFIAFLDGTKKPETEPFIEEDMYKQMYNNLVEKIIAKMGEAKNAKKEKT